MSILTIAGGLDVRICGNNAILLYMRRRNSAIRHCEPVRLVGYPHDRPSRPCTTSRTVVVPSADGEQSSLWIQ